MKNIKLSPIYNMSMCSLENFHTCFLNWLGGIYPAETLKLFLPDKNAQNIKFKHQVKRSNEYIFDLCATMGDDEEEILVIENKLKSFPTEEQLTKYSNIFEGKKATFILLSLAPEVNLPKQWQYLSYNELAKRMHAVFDNAKFETEYHKYLIQDYIDVIDEISNALQIKDTKKLDFYDVPKQLKQLHLRDIYIKYRGALFANFLKKNVQNCEIYSSFHHGKNTIDIVLISNDRYDFRIQLEGNQFRYCFLPAWSDDEKNKEDIAITLLYDQLWFFYTEEYSKKEFCKYGKNFIYRYIKIERLFAKDNLKDVTYQELTNYINKVIKIFFENYKDIDALVKKYEKQNLY